MQSIESALNPLPMVSIEVHLMEAPLLPTRNGDEVLDAMFPRRRQASM
jgi:hypothetical protein